MTALITLMSIRKVRIDSANFNNKDSFLGEEVSELITFKEIKLVENQEWEGEGCIIKVIKRDVENYVQNLEAKFNDKIETWQFGLYEKKSIDLFDGALSIRDGGADFKNKIQKIRVEIK